MSVDQPREPSRIDAGLAPIAAEHIGVALELLEHVGAHVAAAEDRQDLEQARDRGARAEVGRLVGVEQRLLVQEFDPQERPHPLAERLLELDQPCSGDSAGSSAAVFMRLFCASAATLGKRHDLQTPLRALRESRARDSGDAAARLGGACCSTSPLLSITSCAARSRVARSACARDHRERPRRAGCRRGASGARAAAASAQSTTATRSTSAAKSVSTSSGTATIAYGRRTASSRASSRARISGCSSAVERRGVCRHPRTRACAARAGRARRARSSTSAPNASRIAASAGSPGATTSRAI